MPTGIYVRDPAKVYRRPPAEFDRERVRALAAQGMSVREIAAELGGNEEMWRRRMVRAGIPRLPAKARPERNYFWNGGRTVGRSGYVFLRAPAHPRRNRHGYVQEHRLVMERVLGRYLLADEVVDHIDGNPANNDPANLRVFGSNAEHLAVTLRGRCPNWTEQGRANMQASARRKAEKADATLDLLIGSGVPLSRSQRERLRASLRTDRLSPSRRALWQAWLEARPQSARGRGSAPP